MIESNSINLIINSFREGNNSHAFLVETNNIEKCLNDIKYVCKYLNCDNQGDEEEPCNICHLIDIDNDPDVLIIRPDNNLIKTEPIISIIDAFSSKPLLSKWSIYIIVEADKMNDSAANKILKFLEEPEDNILGFFITEKVTNIIPTIRSRCELYVNKYESNNILDALNISQTEYDKYYKKALELVSKLNTEPKYILMRDAKDLSKLERNEILCILKIIQRLYIIKYEYDNHGMHENTNYIQQINDAVVINDINIVVKRIKLLDNSINDFQLSLNRDLFVNNFFIRWE